MSIDYVLIYEQIGGFMKTVADRINRRMVDLNISQADIKRSIGAGKATISSWIKGDTSPSGAYASKLASCLKCNTDWLLSGVGAMNDESKAPSGTALVAITHGMNGMLPVISWVAAGNFSDVIPVTIDDVIEWIPKPVHLSERAFGLVVQGSSMLPEFKPNEIIYVEPEVNPWDLKDGDLVVIHCDDDKQATFKQLMIGDSQEDMYLKPLNPDWPDQKIVPMGACSLVGVVDSKYTRYR